MASAHGGRRPGAGRPARTDLYRQPIREAEGLIRDKLPFLVGQLLQLAEGVRVQETDHEGNAVVYRTPPDRKACEYLLNRVMGTPVQRTESDVRKQAEELAEELGLDADELVRTAERIANRRP